jgi:hypothetical protein
MKIFKIKTDIYKDNIYDQIALFDCEEKCKIMNNFIDKTMLDIKYDLFDKIHYS